MNLQEYYKLKIYQLGYEYATQDQGNNAHKDPTNDIYYTDEADYYICADYYASYVGSDEAWTQEDLDFLEILGFGSGDFIDNDMVEGDQSLDK